ncbi:hypothetical protein BKA70DRAFT_1223063 [Coprinopsis sp. MPI-PUGE-AT-0042]|nr:hypothetical protein BKA70DRAFT_1223063 [Coprinopsis sp. MPI-PUGE-AT-0042]
MPPKKRERSSSVEEIPQAQAPPKLTTYSSSSSSSSRRPTKMRKTATAFQESLAEALAKLPSEGNSDEIRCMITELAESVEAGSVSSARLETNKGLKRISKSMKGKSTKTAATVPMISKATPLGPRRSATGGSKSLSSKPKARSQSSSSKVGVGSVLMLPHGAEEREPEDSGCDDEDDDGIVKVKPLFKFKNKPPILRNDHIESLQAAGMYVEAPEGEPFTFSKTASYEELKAALAALLPLPFAFLTPSMVFHDDEPKPKFLLCLCQRSKPTIASSSRRFPKGSDLSNCWSKLSHAGAMSRRLVIESTPEEIWEDIEDVDDVKHEEEDSIMEDVRMALEEDDLGEDGEDIFPDVPGFTGFVPPQVAPSSSSSARQTTTRPAKVEANKKMRAQMNEESDSEEIEILDPLPSLPSPAPLASTSALSLPSAYTLATPTPAPTRPASPVYEAFEDVNQLSTKLSTHLSVDEGYNPWATNRDFDFQLESLGQARSTEDSLPLLHTLHPFNTSVFLCKRPAAQLEQEMVTTSLKLIAINPRRKRLCQRKVRAHVVCARPEATDSRRVGANSLARD